MSTIAVISGILGGIVLLGNAVVAVKNLIKPAYDLKETVRDHEARIAEVEKKQKKDFEKIEALDEANRMTLRSLVSIMDHMIDGNGVEEMRKTRNDIQDMLAKK